MTEKTNTAIDQQLLRVFLKTGEWKLTNNDKPRLIEEHSTNPQLPSCWKDTNTHARWLMTSRAECEMLVNHINELHQRLDRLEKALNGSHIWLVDSDKINAYLKRIPEANRPGGFIRCKSINPLVLADDDPLNERSGD